MYFGLYIYVLAVPTYDRFRGVFMASIFITCFLNNGYVIDGGVEGKY